MKKTWVKVILVLLITLFFLSLFFKSVNWHELIFYFKTFNRNILPVIIILIPFHYITRALKWRYLFVSRKKKIKFWNLFSAYVIGFTVTFLLPLRAGEVVRPVYLGQKERISRSFSFATVVVERIFDLLTVIFLFGFFLLLKPFYQEYFLERKSALSRLSYSSLIALGIGVALVLVIILLYYFHKSNGFELKIKPFLDNVKRGVFSTRAPKRPNAIGMSVVKLLNIDKNIINVENIDILDGTPLLDIKPYISDFDIHTVEKSGWIENKTLNLNSIKSDKRFK